MTPQERQFLRLAQRRIAGLQPELRAAILRAFQIVRDSYTDEQFARLLAARGVDGVLAEVFSPAVLERAMIPVRQRIRNSVQQGFKYATLDLPAAGTIDGALAVAFDHLSPQVITALRTLETTATSTLTSSVLETARAYIENGLRDGDAPSAIARGLRSVIGLAPNQAAYVDNLERELTDGRFADAAQRQLLDQRFNLEKLASLSASDRAARIETIVSAYRRSYIAFNTNVNTKQMVRDSYRIGQRLAWQDAKAKGVIPAGYISTKTWVHLDPQPHPRPEHQALNGETVKVDEAYSTGQMSAGEGDYGCHCLDRFGVSRA